MCVWTQCIIYFDFKSEVKDYTYSVESVVDDMLEILTHTDLPHKLVLVPVHSCQLTDVGKHIL